MSSASTKLLPLKAGVVLCADDHLIQDLKMQELAHTRLTPRNLLPCFCLLVHPVGAPVLDSLWDCMTRMGLGQVSKDH